MSDAVTTNATDEFFTPERIAELLATPPDLSDLPEIDLSEGWFRSDRISGKVKPRLARGEDGKMHTVFDCAPPQGGGSCQ